jgi:hypothetical protein
MDRRTTIKWMLAASASVAWLGSETARAILTPVARPYGGDPDLSKVYRPGDLWPLTLSAEQRVTAGSLCDLIVPADAWSPAASAVGVVDFIDEWISAPYPAHAADRELVLWGLEWLDDEAAARHSSRFAGLTVSQQTAICDEICYLPKAATRRARAATFFARYRDLTAGGFYTTPAGRKDLQYVGNSPSVTFEGPPIEVLRKVGLA